MEKKYSLLLKNSLFDLFFPPVCIHCGKRIDKQSDYLCQECLAKIEYLFPVVTKVDGLSYDYLISIVKYRDVVVSLIHNLKFFNLSSISDFIAELIYKQIKKIKLILDVNIITAVPLHSVRKRERGYNQSALIAQKLAFLLNCEYRSDIIERVNYTVSQATLEHENRKRNINQAFKLKKNIDLKHKSVILLDDVFTTGSTAEECCKVLKMTEAKKIIVLTMGKA
jgi:ComF family protein